MIQTTSSELNDTLAQRQPPISEVIVDAVALNDDLDPLQMQPLADVIEPDALNQLIEHGLPNGHIEFTYHGHRIRVTNERQITFVGDDR